MAWSRRDGLGLTIAFVAVCILLIFQTSTNDRAPAVAAPVIRLPGGVVAVNNDRGNTSTVPTEGGVAADATAVPQLLTLGNISFEKLSTMTLHEAKKAGSAPNACWDAHCADAWRTPWLFIYDTEQGESIRRNMAMALAGHDPHTLFPVPARSVIHYKPNHSIVVRQPMPKHEYVVCRERNLMLAVAGGYAPDKVQAFVTSFQRHHGHCDTLVLFWSHTAGDLALDVTKQNVVSEEISVWVLLVPPEVATIGWDRRRYAVYSAYLRQRPWPERINFVFSCDVRDTIFFGNVFDPLAAVDFRGVLTVSEEHLFAAPDFPASLTRSWATTFSRDARSSEYISRVPLANGKPMPVLCSGMWGGDEAAVTDFLTLFTDALVNAPEEVREHFAVDQGIFQYLLVVAAPALKFPHNVVIWDKLTGPYRNWAPPSRPESVNAYGQLVNCLGTPYTAVHQADRHGGLWSSMLDLYPSPKNDTWVAEPYPTSDTPSVTAKLTADDGCESRHVAVLHATCESTAPLADRLLVFGRVVVSLLQTLSRECDRVIVIGTVRCVQQMLPSIRDVHRGYPSRVDVYQQTAGGDDAVRSFLVLLRNQSLYTAVVVHDAVDASPVVFASNPFVQWRLEAMASTTAAAAGAVRLHSGRRHVYGGAIDAVIAFAAANRRKPEAADKDKIPLPDTTLLRRNAARSHFFIDGAPC